MVPGSWAEFVLLAMNKAAVKPAAKATVEAAKGTTTGTKCLWLLWVAVSGPHREGNHVEKEKDIRPKHKKDWSSGLNLCFDSALFALSSFKKYREWSEQSDFCGNWLSRKDPFSFASLDCSSFAFLDVHIIHACERRRQHQFFTCFYAFYFLTVPSALPRFVDIPAKPILFLQSPSKCGKICKAYFMVINPFWMPILGAAYQWIAFNKPPKDILLPSTKSPEN